VWPVGVVVVDVVDDEAFELMLVPDDGAIEELAAQCSDPAFSKGVRDRGPNRCLEDLEAFGSEDLVEGAGELAAAVTDECSRVCELVVVALEQVACCLGGRCAGGVGGDAGEEHFAGGDVDEQQQVVATQGGGVDGCEVTGDGCLGAQELGPGDSRALWGRVDAVTFQDSPDRGCSDAVTEAGEFAVMRRYPQVGVSVAMSMMSRRASAAVGGRPGPAVGWVQWWAIRRRCQRRRVSGVTSQPRRRGRGSAAATAPSRVRSPSLS
jgi:hypothetical protein